MVEVNTLENYLLFFIHVAALRGRPNARKHIGYGRYTADPAYEYDLKAVRMYLDSQGLRL